MNKKKLLTRGVLFSYGAIAAQMIYSFASIPLALSYLTTTEFGMWSLIGTITGYMMLAEMGMVNSVMRHLLECTGTGNEEKYGRIFTASAIALTGISLIVFVLGVLAAFVCGMFFPIPPDLLTTFFWVMLLKGTLTAVSLATRMTGVPLYVHHRQDLGQINQIGLFVVYFVVLFLGFRAGFGIYALVLNQAAGLVWSVGMNMIVCVKLSYYPLRRNYAMPTRDEFASVWGLARKVFIMQIGGLFLTSAPQILIARFLGLDISAAWAVYTRSFGILKQIVSRPFDVVLPVIYQSYIRGDMNNAIVRWVATTQITLAVSGVVFAVAAANNVVFVDLWTGGKIHWSGSVQWFIALYFYVIMAAGLAYGSLGMNKNIGRSRYVALLQAVVTILVAIPATQYFSINGLLLTYSVFYIPGMIATGVRYLAKITGHAILPISWKALIHPTLAFPFAAAAAWGCSLLGIAIPGYIGLFLSATSGTLAATTIMLFLGISKESRVKFFSMIAKRFNKFIPDSGQSIM